MLRHICKRLNPLVIWIYVVSSNVSISFLFGFLSDLSRFVKSDCCGSSWHCRIPCQKILELIYHIYHIWYFVSANIFKIGYPLQCQISQDGQFILSEYSCISKLLHLCLCLFSVFLFATLHFCLESFRALSNMFPYLGSKC